MTKQIEATAPCSLTELEQALVGWPRTWTPVNDHFGLVGFDADTDGGNPRIDLESYEDYAPQLGKLIAAAINALPVLIAVAKTSMEFEAADQALATYAALSGTPVFQGKLKAAREARERFVAALAKVTV